MTDEQLRDALKVGLASERDLLRLRRVVEDFKRGGGEKAAALRVMEELRSDLDDAREDRLLEVMDFAAGSCRPELRVWQES